MNPRYLIAAAMIILPPVIVASMPSVRERILNPGVADNSSSSKDVHPAVEESPSSAALPLQQAVDRLDFLNDPKSEDTFKAIVQSRLRKEEFEALEALAARYRATKERFPGGGWKLEALIVDLGEHPMGQDAPEAQWKIHLDRLERWSRSQPFSITAPVVHADAWTDYAWKARGNGYANTVTRRGFGLFEERLAQARLLLNEAIQGGRPRCPSWYARMQSVALGQGWDKAEYDHLFDAAVAQEPLYRTFYRKKADYLQPKWMGEEGDWQAFATEACDRLGGDDGDEMYYYIADFVGDSYDAKPFLALPGFSWDRTKRGFWVAQARNGMPMRQANWHAVYTNVACDQAEAKKVLALIGTRCDTFCWNGKKELFDGWAAWANGPLDESKPQPSQSADLSQGTLGAQASQR